MSDANNVELSNSDPETGLEARGLEAWKRVFYPSDAASAEDPVAHSLQKWKGLHKAILDRYGLTLRNNALTDGTDVFHLTSGVCALCAKHRTDDSCNDCPLFAHLGRPCYEGPEWQDFVSQGNPKPMIQALQELVL